MSKMDGKRLRVVGDPDIEMVDELYGITKEEMELVKEHFMNFIKPPEGIKYYFGTTGKESPEENMTLFDEEEQGHSIIYQPVLGTWYNHMNRIMETALDIVLPKVVKAYEKAHCYPAKEDIFRVFLDCRLEDIKVVILGQDPYYNGNANGYAFGCKESVSPSLHHIIKSIRQYQGTGTQPMEYSNMSLDYLVEQGVFLLNTILTVEAGKPESHAHLGWKPFTAEIVKTISNKTENVVFLLWGNYAKQYTPFIDGNKHLVLDWTHPASAAHNNTEWNCPHFKLTDEWLINKGKSSINWF